MIPFANTWPYEVIMKDIYVSECPFCQSANVLLPLRMKELKVIHEGRKKLLVFPCCMNKLMILDTDADYLLTDQRLRRQ